MRLIALIAAAVRIVGRFIARVALACRYYRALNYSWHTAWVKAERS